MANINISTPFKVNTKLPIDTRFVAEKISDRDAIEAYDGLVVWVTEEQKAYRWKKGVNDTYAWVEEPAAPEGTDVDLSNYYTKDYIDSQFGQTNSAIGIVRDTISDMEGQYATTEDINNINTRIDGVRDEISARLTVADPVAHGSFSLNRKADKTIGSGSIAMGNSTAATASYAFAEGEQTEANGTGAHAMGNKTKANGRYSIAAGGGTVANGEYQTVIGKLNQPDTTSAFIIGNGAKVGTETNALTVDWNGNLVVSGNITDGVGNSFSTLAHDIFTKQDALEFDSAPRANSTNPVTSTGIKDYIDNKVASVYRFKGTLNTYPQQIEEGDVYNIGLNESVMYQVELKDKHPYVLDGYGYFDVGEDFLNNITPDYLIIYFNDETDSGQLLNIGISEYNTNQLKVELPNEIDNLNNVTSIILNCFIKGIKQGDNVAWTGEYWDKLAATIDLSNYYTQTEINNKLNNKVDKVADANLVKIINQPSDGVVDILAADEGNGVTVYNKDQIDTMIEKNKTDIIQISTANAGNVLKLYDHNNKTEVFIWESNRIEQEINKVKTSMSSDTSSDSALLQLALDSSNSIEVFKTPLKSISITIDDTASSPYLPTIEAQFIVDVTANTTNFISVTNGIIQWIGDDCSGGTFTPELDKTYDVVFKPNLTIGNGYWSAKVTRIL